MQHLRLVQNKSYGTKKIIAELVNVNKKFNNGLLALKNINLKIFQNDFLTLLGKSGCGKTTIMKLLCGLLKPTNGYVNWPTSTFTNLSDNPVNLSVVFQEPNLMPWLNVFKNIHLKLNSKSFF